MKDVTKAPASRKGSKRTVQQGRLQEVELPQTAVQQTAAQQVADKTTGASKRTPRRSAAQRQAKAGEGLRSGTDTIGIDIGDRVSQFCRLDASGEIAEQGKLHTNAASLEKHFAKLSSAVIALEAGTQSGWIARLLRRFGHKVTVANPRELAAITASTKKSDRNDALDARVYAYAAVRALFRWDWSWMPRPNDSRPRASPLANNGQPRRSSTRAAGWSVEAHCRTVRTASRCSSNGCRSNAVCVTEVPLA